MSTEQQKDDNSIPHELKEYLDRFLPKKEENECTCRDGMKYRPLCPVCDKEKFEQMKLDSEKFTAKTPAPTSVGLSAERWFDDNSDIYYKNILDDTETRAINKEKFLQHASQLKSVPLVSAEVKSAEEILENKFYKPEACDWYKPVIAAMHEFRNQSVGTGVFEDWKDFLNKKKSFDHTAEMIVKYMGYVRKGDDEGIHKLIHYNIDSKDFWDFIKSAVSEKEERILNHQFPSKSVGSKGVDEKEFTQDQVRLIALEFNNAALYSNSHKQTRQELRASLHEIYDKYNLWGFKGYVMIPTPTTSTEAGSKSLAELLANFGDWYYTVTQNGTRNNMGKIEIAKEYIQLHPFAPSTSGMFTREQVESAMDILARAINKQYYETDPSKIFSIGNKIKEIIASLSPQPVSETDKQWIVREDMICPATKKHCDDECCPVGAKCNLSPNSSGLNESKRQITDPKEIHDLLSNINPYRQDYNAKKQDQFLPVSEDDLLCDKCGKSPDKIYGNETGKYCKECFPVSESYTSCKNCGLAKDGSNKTDKYPAATCSEHDWHTIYFTPVSEGKEEKNRYQQLQFDAAVDSINEPPDRKLGDFDVWYKPCEKCGYDTGKSSIPKNGNKTCWKCGNYVQRDYSDRALKQ